MGEPFAMFPHNVPEFRMGGEAKRTACSANCGNASPARARHRSANTPHRSQSPDSILADLLQFRNLADVDDRRQIAQMLGDPESNIRAAGKNQGMRLGFQRRGQFVNVRGARNADSCNGSSAAPVR